MFKTSIFSIAIIGALFSSFASCAGGVKAFPMNLKDVDVGVPTPIYVENTSDEPTFITVTASNENIVVYPPLIEDLGPGSKEAIQVAFISADFVGKDNYVLVKVGDGGSFKIGVRGK